MIRNSVVFPAPSGPMNPNTSDSFTEKEMLSSAVVDLNFLLIPDVSTALTILIVVLSLENHLTGHT